MKCFICQFLFIIISSSIFCQEACADILKFNVDHYYLVKNNQEKIAYCIHSQDTVSGINLGNDLYVFHVSNDSSILVHLSRKWNMFKPLWNTFYTSDTISLLPVGDIKYVCNGDTIQLRGYKSAYVGPKYVSIQKKKKKGTVLP